MAAPHLFCFGLGYCALALARASRARGWRVSGTVRDARTARALRDEGIEAHLFPLETPEALGEADHLLSSVPPDEAGDPVLRHHRAALTARAGRVRWAGYLSATGVYGNRDGGLVDETSPPMPSGPRGARRAAAEEAWLALPLPVHIFRLAGIYGPGRNALAALQAGTARRIAKAEHVFSRIHVDDVVQALSASMARPHWGQIYNVCDDEPAPQEAVVAYAARLLGVEPPPLVPFAEAALSPAAAGFYADNKRVCNRRLKDELGVTLRYPSYRDGLTALLPPRRSP